MCGYQAQWVQIGGDVKFAVAARKLNPTGDTEWVAIGFSDDQNMVSLG